MVKVSEMIIVDPVSRYLDGEMDFKKIVDRILLIII